MALIATRISDFIQIIADRLAAFGTREELIPIRVTANSRRPAVFHRPRQSER